MVRRKDLTAVFLVGIVVAVAVTIACSGPAQDFSEQPETPTPQPIDTITEQNTPPTKELAGEAAPVAPTQATELANEVEKPSRAPRNLVIIDILPKDGIPAIFHPELVDSSEADSQMVDDEFVIGLTINGDSRAYSVPFLSGHEIVNDVVGGRPVAVTW